MGCPSCLWLVRQDHRLHHPSRGRLQRIGVDMTKEALNLALEALELVSIEFVCNGAHHAKKDRHEWLDPCPIVDRYKEAITAIKEALANEALEKMAENARELGLDYEPEQEPVAWAKFSAKGNIVDLLSEPDDDYTPLYTTPPQRTWVGLTDDEIEHAFKTNSVMVDNGNAYMVAGLRAVNIAQAIEAKLRSKNT